jgi:hypothetical protein
MTRPLKTMTELHRMIGDARAAGSHGALVTGAPKPVLSTSEVHESLNAQVGQLDLGAIGNWRARLFQRQQDGQMQRKLTAARAEQATALMLEKLHGEVQIVRMHFKQDFSDRIAALAESAAASQIVVIRKLKAIEAEARNFVDYDLKAETDELQAMLAQGVIDEVGFIREVEFRIRRYDDLKTRFSELLDGYQSTVQNTYQSGGA